MDSVVLSDKNEYLVVNKNNYQNNIYYYLIDIHNNTNIKFCVEKSETKSLIEVEDANMIQKLVTIFASSINLKDLKASHQDK